MCIRGTSIPFDDQNCYYIISPSEFLFDFNVAVLIFVAFSLHLNPVFIIRIFNDNNLIDYLLFVP